MSNNINDQDEKGLGEWLRIGELDKTPISLDEFVKKTRPLMQTIYEDTSCETDGEDEGNTGGI